MKSSNNENFNLLTKILKIILTLKLKSFLKFILNKDLKIN